MYISKIGKCSSQNYTWLFAELSIAGIENLNTFFSPFFPNYFKMFLIILRQLTKY